MNKKNNKPLDFEAPLYELEEKISQLKELATKQNVNLDKEIKKIQERSNKLKQEIYQNLSANQILKIARHPNRPDSLSLAKLIFDEFIELHGDRLYRDDPAIICGVGKIKKESIAIIGHQKGHDTKENIARNFGMPHPEGYRKALRIMKLAEKFNIPVITFIDTPGAFPGIEAEKRGQAEAIARNLKEMSQLKVPIISFVIGEGGSGGALAIGVSNKVFMLENSVYSVISPEGCASILFKDTSKYEQACNSLKMTSKDLMKLKITDGIIKEPHGGAHYNWKETASNIKEQIILSIQEYNNTNTKQILNERYKKFRNIGSINEIN